MRQVEPVMCWKLIYRVTHKGLDGKEDLTILKYDNFYITWRFLYLKKEMFERRFIKVLYFVLIVKCILSYPG